MPNTAATLERSETVAEAAGGLAAEIDRVCAWLTTAELTAEDVERTIAQAVVLQRWVDQQLAVTVGLLANVMVALRQPLHGRDRATMVRAQAAVLVALAADSRAVADAVDLVALVAERIGV